EGLVEDAIVAGVRVESFPENLPADAVAANAADRRRPLRVVVDPPASCRIQQEEIFGPAMVLLPYDTIDAVLADINRRDRPLALYWFGTVGAEKQRVLEHSLSGGVTINDAMMHAAMQDAPFGGIGASGMGH